VGSFLVAGVLKDTGREVRCKILAQMEFAESIQVYSQFMVVHAPKGLPDGLYDLSFDGYAGKTQKLDGLWVHQTSARFIDSNSIG
jgi:hypothetical protein